jgi:hypothetical protein
VLFFGTLYVKDPLKIFHQPWMNQDKLMNNMREQALGIINNSTFDSIILGTSMLENTSAQEASSSLGGKFTNISLAGSNFKERKVILDYVLREREIKKVIYSLDNLGTYINTHKKKQAYPISNWDYLYDTNKFNDFSVYINDRYLKCLFLFKNTKECIGERKNFDRPNAWYASVFNSYRFGGVERWFKVKNHWEVVGAVRNIVKGIDGIKSGKIIADKHIDKQISHSTKYAKEMIINVAKKHPDTKFLLVLPPYSRLNYALWAQYEIKTFILYKASVKNIVESANKYDNIDVYGWGTESFLDDLANYKDLSHYHHKINTWQLQFIKERKGLLGTQNIDTYLETITKKALEYNVLTHEEKFRKYLK